MSEEERENEKERERPCVCLCVDAESSDFQSVVTCYMLPYSVHR